MPYSPTTWISGTTPASAGNLNNLEGGVVAALRADGSVNATAQQTVFAVDKLVTGQQESGYASSSQTGAASGKNIAAAVNYKTTMTNVPTSITFVAQASALAGTPTFTDSELYGFNFFFPTTGSGDAFWRGKYTTVGN